MARPRRLDCFSYIGLARYFLTFCTYNRQDIFRDAAVVECTIKQFRDVASRESFAVLAYCLMPDHAHLLVEALQETSNLRRFAKLAKQHSGATYAQIWRGRQWQEGYYDRVLREDEDAKRVARYILNNPVRAALVSTPVEYPYLGSDVWTLQELLESIVL